MTFLLKQFHWKSTTKKVKVLKDQLNNETHLLQEQVKANKDLDEQLHRASGEKEKLSKEMSNQTIRFNHELILEKEKQVQKDSSFLKTIREKDEKIGQLESSLMQINQEVNDLHKEHSKKISELNKEINKLTIDSERLKGSDIHSGISKSNQQNSQVFNAFKTIKEVFSEFKETLDRLDKEKESHFKFKALESLVKETDINYSKWKESLKELRHEFSATIEKGYELKLTKYNEELNETEFKLTKAEYALNEEKEKSEILKRQIEIVQQENGMLKKLTNDKDLLVDKVNESNVILDEQNKGMDKNIEDLEMNLNRIKTDHIMTKDEIENMCFVIDDLLCKNQQKLKSHLNILSPKVKSTIEGLIKHYKYF